MESRLHLNFVETEKDETSGILIGLCANVEISEQRTD